MREPRHEGAVRSVARGVLRGERHEEAGRGSRKQYHQRGSRKQYHQAHTHPLA
jgi:hypothetical protein